MVWGMIWLVGKLLSSERKNFIGVPFLRRMKLNLKFLHHKLEPCFCEPQELPCVQSASRKTVQIFLLTNPGVLLLSDSLFTGFMRKLVFSKLPCFCTKLSFNRSAFSDQSIKKRRILHPWSFCQQAGDTEGSKGHPDHHHTYASVSGS